MKYNEFEGSMETGSMEVDFMKENSMEKNSIKEMICRKLMEIEVKEHVKILHAVESGSRAWGFASPDSDYDVRFIYVRPKEFYLGLQPKKDYIDWELNEILDINGWDVSKALQHFHKSNATLFEWSNSPVVYHTTPEWEKIQRVSEHYFSCKSSMYHYYGTASKNYHAYLQEDMVKYKKYFYVLRPILACKWIEKKSVPPPVLFRKLAEGVLEQEMGPVIEELLNKKKQMVEAEKGKRIDRLNEYIEENLVYFKEKTEALQDDRNGDWKELNRIFLELLDEQGL